MPSRETTKFSFYIKYGDWEKVRFLIKMFFKDRYYRRTIILDNIIIPFWLKIPHQHKIFKFEEGRLVEEGTPEEVLEE